jgi:hypothetical protein
MQHYYITLTALIRGNIALIKILNTKAFPSVVALCQRDAVLKRDGPHGFILTKDFSIIV